VDRAAPGNPLAGFRAFLAFCATFLRKRILRVYPAYYGCLTLLVALAAAHLYLRLPGRLELLLHLGMMHNLVDAYVSTMNGVFWTLAIVALAIVYAAKAYVMLTSDGTMHAQLPIRLDAFVFGMCAGRYAARTPLDRSYAPIAFYAGLLALFSTPILFSDLATGNHYYSFKGFVRPLWIQLGVILMLLGMTGERHPGVAIFGNKVAVGLGLISYSIYLLHVPVMELFIIYRPKQGALASMPFGLPLVIAGLFPLVIAASFLSYKLIEQPFQRRRAWRHRWWSGSGKGMLDRVDPLLVLLAWAVLLMLALEFLR
jgi:peptidoglycan/LPS O-acetylase OafA/YrhL